MHTKQNVLFFPFFRSYLLLENKFTQACEPKVNAKNFYVNDFNNLSQNIRSRNSKQHCVHIPLCLYEVLPTFQTCRLSKPLCQDIQRGFIDNVYHITIQKHPRVALIFSSCAPVFERPDITLLVAKAKANGSSTFLLNQF